VPALPAAPRYGARSLPDVLPSLLTALGVPGFAGPLAMPPARSACLLLLDGLGWELLAEHAADAPFLAGLAAGAEPLDAGFPATTATSITSVCTGLSPGEHGIVGYSFAVPELLNALSWRSPEGVDLRAAAEPEQVQPNPTVFERAAAAGVGVRVLLPAVHRRSGLTRAALRGAEYVGVHGLGDLTAGVLDALGEARSLCYAYFADLDLMGHRYGPGSTPWRCQLGFVDRLVEVIAQRLPRGALLAVVADHGMVALADPVDADTDPRLRCGVRLIGGDVRARHVYAEPGAAGKRAGGLARGARPPGLGGRPGRGRRGRVVRPRGGSRRARPHRRRGGRRPRSARRGALGRRAPRNRHGGPPRLPDPRRPARPSAPDPRMTQRAET
jgi:hypothetical protein